MAISIVAASARASTPVWKAAVHGSFTAVAALYSATLLAAAPVHAAGLMPDAFARLHLGMSQAALRQLRPAASAGGLHAGDTAYPKLLFEAVDTPFITQAIYLFDERRPVLDGVVFVGTRPCTEAPQAVQAFQAAVVARWGLPDGAAETRGDDGGRDIALVWRRPDAVVVASYPAAPAAGRPCATTVRIGGRTSVVAAFADGLRHLEDGAPDNPMRALRPAAEPATGSIPFN
jgi:hypothetical protein